jgi:hypothetical protein
MGWVRILLSHLSFPVMAWFGIHCCMSSVWCIRWSLSFQ